MKSRTTHTTPKAVSRICLGKIGERSRSEEGYFAAEETEREGNNVNEDTRQTVSSEFAPLASQALFSMFIYIHVLLLSSRHLTISTSSVLLFLLPRWLCIAPMPLPRRPTHCKKMETHVASFEYPMQK